MTGLSKIEWTDRTWNPTTGCTKVSPGCDHCYAEGIARRFAGSKAFPRGFDVTLHPERLDAPLRWRKPARVFVNSMSDLFHDDVPDEFIARVFAVMAVTPQHTYQVLTKRHGRMRSLLSDEGFVGEVAQEAVGGNVHDGWPEVPVEPGIPWWPLRNVWLGVSVEDQKRADLRIPPLLATPAAVRFLSCEPLLGPVDLLGQPDHGCDEAGPAITHDGYTIRTDYGTGIEHDCDHQIGIDWVIVVGGESGPGARPLDIDWVRSLVEQCERADVPAFVKQLGSQYGPSKGGAIETFPAHLRVRQFPTAVTT